MSLEDEDFSDDTNIDDVIPTFEAEEWLKKRKRITFIVYGYCLLHGTEYSAIILSLYYYLAELELKHIILYYSLAMGGMATSATLTAFTFGYLADKRVSFRRTMFIIVMLSIVGNLCYSFHFSVWLVVFGRVLCGFGEAICTASTAEFKRLYSNGEREVVLHRLEVAYIAGFLFGPVLCLITHSMGMRMGAWHISTYNAFTIFLIISLIICLIAVHLGVADISDEPIEELAMLPERMAIGRTNSTRRSLELTTSKFTRAKILNRLNIGLICYSSAILNYVAVVTELTLPIIARNLYGWSFLRLSVVMLVSVSIFLMLYVVLNKRLPTGIGSMYNLFIVCLLLLSLSLSLLLLIFNATSESSLVQNLLIFTVTVINSCGGLTAIRLTNLLFVHSVPAPDKTFYRILGLIGYCSACVIIPYMNIIIPVVMIMLTTAAILLLVQKKYFEEVVRTNKGGGGIERNIEQQLSGEDEGSPHVRKKVRLGIVRMGSLRRGR